MNRKPLTLFIGVLLLLLAALLLFTFQVRQSEVAIVTTFGRVSRAAAQGAKFAMIEKEMLAALQSQVHSNNYGLEIEFLGIKRLGLPESVTSDVFEQMKKEREVLFSRLQAEGEAEAAIIRSDADRKAS